MIPYIPHTDADRERMLKAIGVASMDELFSDIPSGIVYGKELPIAAGLSEEEVLGQFKHLASLNRVGVSFLGMGSYDHIIPSSVKDLSALPAFVTSYTPYQPEISQGLLQAIFEFQTMVCELTGLDVANASLYDGHSAAAEAAAMMLASKRKSTVVLVSETVHPFTLEVLETWCYGTGFSIRTIAECNRTTDITGIPGLLDAQVAGVLVQSPNRYGFIEDYTDLARSVHENGSLLTISSDPLSLVIQRSQGEWDADIAIGDTQPLGLPCAFGGPSCGYIAVREALMRKLPGRIVGQTVDTGGKRAFTLTLQAREQHIKRERATSNICSNQALAALTTTIHLSLVGYAGMLEAARSSQDKTHYLARQLVGTPHVVMGGTAPFWCEFPLVFDTVETMEKTLAALLAEGLHGGIRLGTLTGRPADASTCVVAVTEKRTKAELDRYVRIVREVLA
ncbi:MAG: aminomethyl-transferring glycine dehydrogenase subunit GcvPA [Sphaerochaetaceae bacterium]